ncbi:hypothetical protein AQI84_00380 [Streptomyces griseorubiginosus]|nr:hypothetical protein AQI84_00380 [Streptomyces griseorubiginosus]
MGQVVAGPQPGECAYQHGPVQPGDLLAQHRGRGDKQAADVVHCLVAGSDGAAAGHPQDPHRLDHAVPTLGTPVARPHSTAVAAA